VVLSQTMMIECAQPFLCDARLLFAKQESSQQSSLGHKVNECNLHTTQTHADPDSSAMSQAQTQALVASWVQINRFATKGTAANYGMSQPANTRQGQACIWTVAAITSCHIMPFQPAQGRLQNLISHDGCEQYCCPHSQGCLTQAIWVATETCPC